MMPLSTVAPAIAKRIGTRRTLMVGLGLFGIGSLLLATLVSVEGGYWSVMPGLLVLGRRHGSDDEPVDDGDHRVAAAGEARASHRR